MSKHLLSIRQSTVSELNELLKAAAEFKKAVKAGKSAATAEKKVIGLLFFENSTRTRVSFEQAANYLGFRVSNFAAGQSSLSKGETLKDTILTLSRERLDAVVMRHHSSGAPYLATKYFGGPVINAGDGQHEHPTQALGDALTILEAKKTIKGLKVAIVGDVLHSRVARSNAWLLSKMGAEVRLCGPSTLMPRHMGMLPGEVFNELLPAIHDVDVIMCLRLQRERMDDGLMLSIGEYRRMYQVNRETLLVAKSDCMVMHPGPINRGIEIDDYAADGIHSVIQEQVENGIFVRMAALNWVFKAPPKAAPKPAAKAAKPKAKAKTPAGAKS